MAEEQAHINPAMEALRQTPQRGLLRDDYLNVVIVGITNSSERAYAREAAFNQLTHEITAGGLRTRAWHGNIARGYYLTKYTHDARQRLITSGNLLYFHNAEPEAYEQPITKRFAQLGRTAVRTELGERYEEALPFQANENSHPLEQQVLDLIVDFATNKINHADFTARKETIYAAPEHQQILKRLLGGGALHADNLYAVSTAVKEAAATGGMTLDGLRRSFRLITGTAYAGVVADPPSGRAERTAQKLANLPFVDEAAVASAISIGYTALGWGAKSTLGAATKGLAPGIAAGVWAGLREYGMATEERAYTTRRAAQGLATETQRNYYAVHGMMPTTRLLKALQNVIHPNGGNDYLETSLKTIAYAEVRELMLRRQRITMTSALAPETADSEDTALLIATTKAKDALRSFIEDTFDALLDENVQATLRATLGHIEQKNKVFRSHLRKWVGVAAITGVVVGGAIGILLQELIAAVSTARQGLIKQAFGHSNEARQQTLLASLLPQTGPQVVSPQPGAAVSLSEQNILQLPKDWRAERQGDSLTLHGPNGTKIEHLPLNKEGSLSPQAGEALQKRSFTLDATPKTITTPITERQVVSAQTFMERHGATRIAIDSWYGNGTPYPDGNEVGLQYANTGPNGPIVVDVANMSAYGSRLDSLSIRWQEAAAQGRLKLFISATPGTQSQAFELPIGPDGKVDVSNHEHARQLFTTVNGQPRFLGHYLQAAEVAERKDGTTHIRPLATVVGSGKVTFTDTITTEQSRRITVYSLRPTDAQTKQVGVPMFAPLYLRRGLHTQRKKRRNHNTTTKAR